MVLPKTQQTAQQIGAPQHRAVFWSHPTDGDVVAPTRARVSAIEHKFLRTQATLPGSFKNMVVNVQDFRPVFGRLDVHFDHPRVGRNPQFFHPIVARRFVTFDDNRDFQALCR